MGLNVILVDDEKGIVDGLKKIIERYIPECEVIGVAYNGLEGFKLIQKQQPDIVITDIRMPHAGGLDMITMLKEHGCKAKFILLSGYADFEYARRGMQLGVQFYINKPVEQGELRECICKVMEEIRADRTKLQEVDNLKQEVHSLIQENALRDILDLSSDHTVHVEELFQMAGIPLDGTRLVSVLLEFDSSLGNMKERQLDPVLRLIDRVMGQYCKVHRFRYSRSQVALVVTNNERMEYGEVIRAIQRLKEAIYRELKLFVTIGVGTLQERATGISQSFEEARHALSYKVIKGMDVVIPYHEIIKLTRSRHYVSEEMITGLESGLENMDEKGCVSIIRDIFQRMEAEKGLSPADLQLHCLNILLSSVRKMSFQQLQENDYLGQQILSLEGISRFRTLERLEEWMVQVIEGIIALKMANNVPLKKDIIVVIKDYILENYNSPISLADLSARFLINPSYLSQLFKQKTGDSYLNFLAQTRINKAKELLERTDLKVLEICQMVGYSDTVHFARLFEKVTGCKPSEYRKNPSIG